MEAGLKMEGSMLQVIILREFKTTCGIAGKGWFVCEETDV